MAEKKGLTAEEISKLGPAARAQIAASMVVEDTAIPPHVQRQDKTEKAADKIMKAAESISTAAGVLEKAASAIQSTLDKPFRQAAAQWPPIPPRGPDGKFMPWGAMPMAPLYASNNQEKREHQSDDRAKEQREQDRKRAFASFDRKLSKISDGVDKTNLKLDDLIAVNNKILEKTIANNPNLKQSSMWDSLKSMIGLGAGAGAGGAGLFGALKGAAPAAASAAAPAAAEAAAGAGAAAAGAKKLGFVSKLGRGFGLGVLGDLAGGGLHLGADALDSAGYKKTSAATDILGYTAQGAGWGAAAGTIVPGVGNMIGAGAGAAAGGLYGLYMRGKAAFGYEDAPVNENVTGGGFGGEDAPKAQPQSHMMTDPSKSGAIHELESRTKEIKTDNSDKVLKGNEVKLEGQNVTIGSKTGGQVIRFESPQIIFEADKFEFVTRGGKGGGSGSGFGNGSGGSSGGSGSGWSPGGGQPGSSQGGQTGGSPSGSRGGSTDGSGKAHSPGDQTDEAKTTAGGHPYLASIRQKYFDEMEKDPNLKKTVMGLVMQENGSHPEGPLESLMNRAAIDGRSLKSHVYGGFYGPINRGEISGTDALGRKEMQRVQSAFDRVRGGSNDIDLRTDQGMINEHKWADSVAAQGRGRKEKIQGEYYSDKGPTYERGSQQIRANMEKYDREHPEWRDQNGSFGEHDRVTESQSRVAAIRKQPISPQLKEVMQYAAEKSGVMVDVTSGGQDSHGPNRTGSHRHDRGGAGDVDLYVTENGKRRKLDFNQYADRQKYEDFVMHSRAAGATGIGAGSEYMGSSRIHVGFGDQATWGSAAGGWLGRSYKIGARMGPEEFQKWRKARQEAQQQQKQAGEGKSGPVPTSGPVPGYSPEIMDRFMKNYQPMDENRAREVQQATQARLIASTQTPNRAQAVATATQAEVLKPGPSTVGQIDPADWERSRRTQDEMRRDPEGARGRNRMEMERRNDQQQKEEKVSDVGQPDAYLSSLFDTWNPSVLGAMKTG